MGRDRALPQILALAAVSYIPLLLGRPGHLNADTKQYLYLDPGRLLQGAPHLWDPLTAGGTVTHQNIGYLWPMGPFFWAADQLGLPDWVAQRLWIGTILFAAGAGALVLLRHLLPHSPLLAVAAASYGLSPVVLGHITGQSALLVSFSALPWLVWATRRALDTGGWGFSALIALLVASAGSVNGSSVFFVLIAVGLLVPYAVGVERSVSLASAVGVVARTFALTVGCQLWWVAAYVTGGAVGLPLLATTETVGTTSYTASASEITRGLGYWFFYGRDASRPWLDGLSPPYMTSPLLIAISFAVPVLALALASAARWPGRRYAAALVLAGLAISSIAFPRPLRSPLGTAFSSLSLHSDLVLSLRNTQRAAPLMVLGLALGLGAGLVALSNRHGRAAICAAVAFTLLIAGSVPALWRTGYVADRFHREEVPSYWRQAAAHLATGEGRILELPGIDFAAYRWGNTLDPITPGLVDRSFVARQLVPQGSRGQVSLLNALDRSIQEGTFEPASLPATARLLGAQDIVVRSDLEYERYRTARPRRVWDWVQRAAGLGRPVTFGVGIPNVADPRRPMIDEIELGLGDAPTPPSVAVLPVPGPPPGLLTARHTSATVIAGDGAGIVAAAAAGLLDGRGTVLLSSDLTRPGVAAELGLGPDARFVLTDANRKRTERWYSLRENVGATEPATATVVADASGVARLPIVDNQRPDAQSTSELVGVASIRASSYGNPFTLSPEDRPAFALDGDPETAWRVDTGTLPGPYWLEVDLRRPIRADHLVLHPPVGRLGTRVLTRAEVVLDSTRHVSVVGADGGPIRVDLDGEPFQSVRVRILGVGPYSGPAGLSEIEIPGVAGREFVALPRDLFRLLPDAPDRFAIVLSRERADAAEPVRADPEPAIARRFTLPWQDSLQLGGTVRVSARAADDVLDSILQPRSGDRGWIRATSGERLPGSIAARASAALDGDLSTAWSTPFVGVVGQWWQAVLVAPTRIDHLDIDVVADARHSLPTALDVQTDDGAPVHVALPALTRQATLGATRRITVPLATPVTGRAVRITISGIDAATTPDWYSGQPSVLPVALAEVRLPGVRPQAADSAIDTGCRSDLVSLDGQPIPVQARGTVADATSVTGIPLRACTGAATDLAMGPHEVLTATGRHLGIDVDRLVWRTEGYDRPDAAVSAPIVRVDHARGGALDAHVTTGGQPFWLVLDQGENAGWKADVPGARVEGPHVIDGWRQGWLVRPTQASTLEITIRWTPQRLVNIALAISAAFALLCLALITGCIRDRTRRPERSPAAPMLRLTIGKPSPRGVVLSAAFAALAIHPLAGVAMGAAGAAARRWSTARRWIALAPVILLVGAAAFVILGQTVRPHQPSAGWPGTFWPAHLAAAAAIHLWALLAHAEDAASDLDHTVVMSE